MDNTDINRNANEGFSLFSEAYAEENTNIIYHSDEYSDIDDESITILDKEKMNNYLINHTNNNFVGNNINF